ncbi:MAG: ECF transporter S component [Erysipelotrichaceae bacterium]|nr:ECF transporter S component [Erysipelotrichaceae bacterium]
MNTKQLFTTKKMAIVAILSSMSAVLMLVSFPLPFFPSFYRLDFSEVPVLIGAFALGPIYGIMIEVIKILLNTILNGTITAYVGEIANLLIGISFVVPASIIYRANRTKKGALLSLLSSIMIMTTCAVVLNYFVLIPAYSAIANFPLEAILSMGSKINPLVVNKLSFVLFMTLPFNVLKGVLVSIILIMIYKNISTLIKRVIA